MGYKYMPINVSVLNRPCLVVGGGAVALRKVESLLDYDVAITVVAPEVNEKLAYHADKGRIKLEKREYRSPEAAAFGLVISASDDRELNRRVYEDAQGSGALVNVVDDPPHCDFTFPAVVRRDSLTAAISTDGTAPFLSGHLRLVLENVFPDHWTRVAKLAARFRKQVQEKWADDVSKRNACFAQFLEADWKAMLKEMDDEGIQGELERMLNVPE